MPRLNQNWSVSFKYRVNRYLSLSLSSLLFFLSFSARVSIVVTCLLGLRSAVPHCDPGPTPAITGRLMNIKITIENKDTVKARVRYNGYTIEQNYGVVQFEIDNLKIDTWKRKLRDGVSRIKIFITVKINLYEYSVKSSSSVYFVNY